MPTDWTPIIYDRNPYPLAIRFDPTNGAAYFRDLRPNASPGNETRYSADRFARDWYIYQDNEGRLHLAHASEMKAAGIERSLKKGC